MPNKQLLLASLGDLQDSLTNISRAIQVTKTVLLAPAIFGQEVDDAVRVWAERVEKEIVKFGVDGTVCAKETLNKPVSSR